MFNTRVVALEQEEKTLILIAEGADLPSQYSPRVSSDFNATTTSSSASSNADDDVERGEAVRAAAIANLNAEGLTIRQELAAITFAEMEILTEFQVKLKSLNAK
jgi:hypothetical protein